MAAEFSTAYTNLNNAQRQAVDTIDGPVLVLAGPGTGKTQLLSMRAAKIVAEGNANASNILCLTYTEAGASEMRERMGRLMGVNGSEVSVYTFHGFGSWLISQYPEYFSRERNLKPLDDLSRYTLFRSLLEKLPFRHQLAIHDDQEHFIRQHAVEEAIHAFKEAGLTPDTVRTVLKKNTQEYAALQPLLDEIFGTKLSAKRLPEIAAAVAEQQAQAGPYAELLLSSLTDAIGEAEAAGKTASIGVWRDAHTRSKDGKRVLKSALDQSLLADVIKLYEQYQQALDQHGWFDYEDMILWAINALQNEPDMLLDIAERFQYIMVDEYQDTNGAQNQLLDCLLQANPLDSPNVLVVGDDDQAIMRFQGAEVSNMLQFVQRYQPTIIALEDNYRSSQPILDAATAVIADSNERLVDQPDLQTITKQLRAHNAIGETPLQFTTFQSTTAEYAGVADLIAAQLEQGVAPQDIGVIGRKHAALGDFVPHLAGRGIAVAYDKRENILDNPRIAQLLRLARYINTLAQTPQRAEQLLPALLTDDYWQLGPLASYHIAAKARENGDSWLDVMLAGDITWAAIAQWLLTTAETAQNYNFTQIFDILIGRHEVANTDLQYSPFKHIYNEQPAEIYAEILSHLIRLRQAVLETNPEARSLGDVLEVCDRYRQSGIRLIDDNPLLRGDSSGIQIMTAHSSKGREFSHVYVLSCVDEVWGNRARSNNQRIRLPENLPLYAAGDTIDDRLRLLYVALTRAKQSLHLSTHLQTDEGRSRTPLALLTDSLQDSRWQQTTVETSPADPTAISALETAWQPVSTVPSRELSSVLEPLTKNYRLSPTALRDFLDICYAGPQTCIERHVLKFPSSYNAYSALGSAVHKTLQVAHSRFADGKPFTDSELLQNFDTALDASSLSAEELEPARAHAHQFLPVFVAQFADDFAAITHTEEFMRGESPQFGTPLSGVLDALVIDKQGIRIIDYKTGKPPLPDWKTTGLGDSKKISLHFYRQQLLFYALLVQSSKTTAEPVIGAELVFVEDSSDKPSEFVRLSITDFSAEELNRTERLIAAVYQRIISANLPDTSQYPTTLAGIQAFENALLDGTI